MTMKTEFCDNNHVQIIYESYQDNDCPICRFRDWIFLNCTSTDVRCGNGHKTIMYAAKLDGTTVCPLCEVLSEFRP